ncbi:MAG TPA: hypothetical protein VFH78_00135 [Candidatus Thermoplasmatota archaeon]|nr:hypothetical protein [Candidatus Thermoplasmatota archaeon]
MALPLVHAQPALVRDTLEALPLEREEVAEAHCVGVAPINPRCGVSFQARYGISTSVSGTFTGELLCRFVGPYGSWIEYRMQVVTGLLVSATAAGPGLYAGVITLGCEARGPFGAGGTLAGAGTFDVRVAYS